MGTIRKPESIAKLAKLTATTLSLPASTFNIGGQQYNTLNALTLNTATVGAGGVDATIVAGSLYTVYAVISSGQVYLIASLNSSLPSGFTQARAVGGFNTNTSSQIDQVASQAGDLSIVGTGSFLGGMTAATNQNIVINGALEFWQRGTSFAAAADGALADRFKLGKNGTMAVTIDKQTDAPTYSQCGFSLQSCLRILTTTAQASISAANYFFLEQRIEGNNYQPLHGKPFRLQFWVKSNKVGVGTVCFTNSATNRTYLASYTINSINTWEKKVIDLVGDSTGTWLFDNTIGLRLQWALACGSTYQNTTGSWLAGNYLSSSTQTNFFDTLNNDFRITGVQLVPGQFSASVDLPFQRAGGTIGGELALCQRYYERISQTTMSGGSDYYTAVGLACIEGASNAYMFIPYKVTKRVPVSIPTTDTSGSFVVGATASWTVDEYYGTGLEGIRLRLLKTSHGLTQGLSYVVFFNAAVQTNGYIAFNAEL